MKLTPKCHKAHNEDEMNKLSLTDIVLREREGWAMAIAGKVVRDLDERVSATDAALAQQAQPEDDTCGECELQTEQYRCPDCPQQAQPLTDDVERASAEYVATHSVELFGTVGDFRGTFKAGAEWYRDRMAQQAQPEPRKTELVCWCADGPLGFCPQHST